MNYTDIIKTTVNTGQNLIQGAFKSSENTCSVTYKFAFNGKQKDDEVDGEGRSYNYGARIYDADLGRFLSVDPKAGIYPYYTPYQFAGNKPIYALDLDGLEDIAYIYKMNTDNSGYTLLNVVDYTKTDAGTGPLGHGVYTSMVSSSGASFSEVFTTVKGNSISSFKNSDVPTKNWNTGNLNKSVDLRLSGLLMQKVVQKALIDKGFKREDVEKDVQVLDIDNPKFVGKFATFLAGAAEKYTKDWEPASYLNPNHGSTEEKTSSEIGSSDVLMKYYNGASSSSDNIPDHVGLVREGIIDHSIEAARAGSNSNVNIGVENAEKVKQDNEKTP